MHIDFISDISCPWCAIGVSALVRAHERIGDDIQVELHFRPFELNPDMPPEGEDLKGYLTRRPGMDSEQVKASHALLHERGAAAGFTFGHRSRIWNTFDAHRLLSWADAEGPAGSQKRLKLALMRAYHGENRNPGAHEVLLELAGEAGLDVDRARGVLDSLAFADQVRSAQRHWHEAGIHSVPTMIVDKRIGVSGSRSADEYERILRELNARMPAGTG